MKSTLISTSLLIHKISSLVHNKCISTAITNLPILFKMMNSSSNFECQMMNLSIGFASSMTRSSPACIFEDYEFDCSRFAVSSVGLSTSHQATEQRMGGPGNLSRSQCVNNLSSLGDLFSSVSCGSSSSRQMILGNQNPGYFVDTPSRYVSFSSVEIMKT